MNNSVSHTSTDFVVFAIENTAKRLGIPGNKVYQALQSSNGIQDFLYPSYPTLHTQGKEYITREVIEYLNEQLPTTMPEDDPIINDTLLQLKYSRIIVLLAEKLEIEIPQAMDIFYTSDFYNDLSDKANQLHNMGDQYLAESIILELQQR